MARRRRTADLTLRFYRPARRYQLERRIFCIGKDGKILAIEAVKPATSADHMAAKPGELGISSR